MGESLKSFKELGEVFKPTKEVSKSTEPSSQSLGAAAVIKIARKKDVNNNSSGDSGRKITNEEFAKLVVEQTMGEDIFKKKVEKLVNKEHKTAIDQQIDKLENELKDIEKNFGIVKEKGTKKQIEERQKRIEFLKEEIKKAEEIKNFEIPKIKKIKKEKEQKSKFKKEKIDNLKKETVNNEKEIEEIKKVRNELDILGKELVLLQKEAKITKNVEENQDEINSIIKKRDALKLRRDELKEKDKIKKPGDVEKNIETARLPEEIFGITNEEFVSLFRAKQEVKQEEIKNVKEIKLTDNQQTEIEKKLGEFNIKQEDIEKINEFKELSYDQRLLVLENFKQLTLEKIQKEALIKYEENAAESNFLGKIWDGVTRKYQIAKWEKLIAENFNQGGIEIYGKFLNQSVENVKKMDRFLTTALANRRARIEAEKNKLNLEIEKKLEKESVEIKEEIEKIPEEEKKKIGSGLLNLGFYATKLKSDAMAWICDKAVIGIEKPIQEQGAIKRFLVSVAETYKKDSEKASKQIELPASLVSIKSASSTGQIISGILKYGRTVADIVGWTAGSPLRYVMAGAQFFSRGMEAAKEARLINAEIIKKTRVKDIDEAADEAWKIYEIAKIKAGIGNVTKEFLEKSYAENLPQDLLERLKKSEPGTATGILQKILKKDLELAIKYGRVNKARLKEYDKMISQYGNVDVLAMGAKYAETAGKAVVAGVQIETAVLLMQKLPEIMEKLSSISIFENEPQKIEELKIGGKVAWQRQELLELKQQSTLDAAKEIAGKADLEKAQTHLAEISTIQKEEGIEHALIRQLNDNPQKFGFDGDINNKTELKIWANNEAHRLAIKSGYVDSKTGTETWIRGGKEKPIFVILQDDKTIKFENADLYKHPTKIPIGNDKKVFDLFNQQKTIPEKWKIIQEYQYDIDLMKANLDKFPDPQVKASIQAEIDRLDKIEQFLINKLAEQTASASEISQSTEITGAETGEKIILK